MSEVTPVVFRVDRLSGDVVAVFPSMKERNGFACYARVGQHSICSAGYVRNMTRAAKPAEYAALRTELESAPYHYRLTLARRESVIGGAK